MGGKAEIFNNSKERVVGAVLITASLFAPNQARVVDAASGNIFQRQDIAIVAPDQQFGTEPNTPEVLYPQLAQAGLFPRTVDILESNPIDLKRGITCNNQRVCASYIGNPNMGGEIFTTNPSSEIPTKIYNYTDLNVNHAAAQDVYNFLDSFQNSNQIYREYSLNGRKILIHFNQDIRTTSRTMVAVPPSAPMPGFDNESSESGKMFTQQPAMTTLFVDGKRFSVLKLVNLYKLKTKADSLTVVASTEACQQTLRVLPTDENNNFISDIDVQRLTQETMCNELGLAMGAKMMGLKYGAYKQLALPYNLFIPSFSAAHFPLTPITEELYNLMPSNGPIFEQAG